MQNNLCKRSLTSGLFVKKKIVFPCVKKETNLFAFKEFNKVNGLYSAEICCSNSRHKRNNVLVMKCLYLNILSTQTKAVIYGCSWK